MFYTEEKELRAQNSARIRFDDHGKTLREEPVNLAN